MKLGVHVSIAGSIDLSIDRAKSLGLDTFQILKISVELFFLYSENTHGFLYIRRIHVLVSNL